MQRRTKVRRPPLVAVIRHRCVVAAIAISAAAMLRGAIRFAGRGMGVARLIILNFTQPWVCEVRVGDPCGQNNSADNCDSKPSL